jgi:ribosomal protein S18 acetylase RimI-like enzyme
MENIVITTATPADVEGIQTVFDEAWLDTYPNEEAGITVEDILDRRKDSFSEERLQKRREYFANIPDGQKFVVAKEGDKVVGLCNLMIEPEYNKLSTIYILPAYQGKGIGQMLWKAVSPFLDNSKDTIVQVATYNMKAIAFYEKLGFVDTGKRFSDEKFRMKSGALLPEMEMVINAEK